MKTASSLFLTLFVAASFSLPTAWAGEPNPDALTSQSKSDKRKATPDCSSEACQEVSSSDSRSIAGVVREKPGNETELSIDRNYAHDVRYKAAR